MPVDPVLDEIESASFVVADITRLNFNVAYEVGFSIGKNKRVVLSRNTTVARDERLARETGIFDTIGYLDYANSDDLTKYLLELRDLTPFPLKQTVPNRRAPVYLLLPREKAEAEIRLVSRIKKEARLFFRSFDPEEHGRISVRDAIETSPHRSVSFCHSFRLTEPIVRFTTFVDGMPLRLFALVCPAVFRQPRKPC